MTMRCDEEMIEVAVKHFGHEFLAEAADATEGDCTASESFDKKMRALIGRKAARRTGKQALKVLSRVAAILFVVVIVFSVAVLSSEALRSRFINLLYEVGGNKAEISFTGIDTEQLPEGIVIPDYLPDGYELAKTEGELPSIISWYENEAGDVIIISQGSLDVHITATQTGAYETEIAGRTAYVVDQEGGKAVIFNNDWYSFIINGNADISTLLKIAESMLD